MADRLESFMARWRVPAGFALGAAYAIFAEPTRPLLIVGSLIALAGLGIRAYAAGHIEKNRKLAVGGPYAYTRNPLYFGSLLIGLGLVVAGGRWVLALVFVVFFACFYGPVMGREAANLRSHFGRDYERYAAAVPLFLPYRRPFRVSGERFEWERYRKNREYKAALGYLVGIVFLILKILLR